MSRPGDFKAAAGLSFLFLIVYWLGHCPTFGPGESPRLVTAAILNRGGPFLYTWLGHLASLWPFGSPAGNVNGLSGLFHAAAIGVFFLLLRGWGLSSLSCLFAALLLGFSKYFWYYSEVASIQPLMDTSALSLVFLIQRRKKTWAALVGLACVAASLSIGVSAGAGFAFDWLAKRSRPGISRLILAGACAVPLVRTVDLRHHNPLMEYARGLVLSSGTGDVIVLADDGPYYALEYLRDVEKSADARVFLRAPVAWMQLARTYPTKNILAEAPLLEGVLAAFPRSVPSGLLIHVTDRPASKAEVARRAGEVSSWPCLDSIRRRDRYFFTEETELETSYGKILSWYLTFLASKDQETASRIKARLADL